MILCDTNGGTLPEEIAERVAGSAHGMLALRRRHPLPQRLRRGRRQHAGRRRPGATQVQGTINGIGERCGNVDLVSVIANLGLKRGYEVLQPGSLRAADRGVALRLRNRQHELPHRPAVRRRQRLRPQGRHAHPRRRQASRELRAHRPGARRQRTAHSGQRTVGAIDHPDEDDQVRHRRTTRR